MLLEEQKEEQSGTQGSRLKIAVHDQDPLSLWLSLFRLESMKKPVDTAPSLSCADDPSLDESDKAL